VLLAETRSHPSGSLVFATYVLGGGVALQVRLDRLVLLVELGEIGHQVLDDEGVRERVDLHVGGVLGGDAACQLSASVPHVFLPRIRQPHTQASEGVGAVDVHGAAAADALSAAAAEGEGRVELVLDADQGVEDHGPGLVEVEGVALHARLLGRCVGVPAVDLEGLEVGLVARGGLVLLLAVGDGGHAADGRGRDGGAQGRPGRGGAEQAGGGRAESCHGREPGD